MVRTYKEYDSEFTISQGSYVSMYGVRLGAVESYIRCPDGR